ncbi:MAG: phosphoribosylglycinamide formyltransferase [Gammaproteobacteria bacterium]
MSRDALRLVVLISGGGTNLQSIIDRTQSDKLNAVVAGVVSSRADAFGLERAERAGIPTAVLTAVDHPDRESYDQALAQCVADFDAELIALAGFMRILTAPFVDAYSGRLLNIHPSLLPRYRGMNTYRRVLENGDPVHGTSVHFVTLDLDAGPLIAQARVAVRDDDDEASLSARVQATEHILYPRVIGWCADDRLCMHDGRVSLDGEYLSGPVQFDYEDGVLKPDTRATTT